MPVIKSVRGIHPVFGKNCFLAENAVVVGEVTMGDYCSIWFNTVVRGDVHSITIGNETNIQDGAVIHCTYQKSKTVIGDQVSIAHNAIVHACTIQDRVLIGMGAVVMDDSVIRSGSIIAAGAVVLPNTIVESGCVYGGVPAQKIKEVGPELKEVFEHTARNYVMYAGWYQENSVDKT